MSVGMLYGAISIRKVEKSGRSVVTVFSSLGLILYPFGSLINCYFLYLLWTKKGRFIFTPKYQKVIKATPHIKCKTHIAVWILLGLAFAALGIAVSIA